MLIPWTLSLLRFSSGTYYNLQYQELDVYSSSSFFLFFLFYNETKDQISSVAHDFPVVFSIIFLVFSI